MTKQTLETPLNRYNPSIFGKEQYSSNDCVIIMKKDSEGDYVLYSDVEKILKSLKENLQ